MFFILDFLSNLTRIIFFKQLDSLFFFFSSAWSLLSLLQISLF